MHSDQSDQLVSTQRALHIHCVWYKRGREYVDSIKSVVGGCQDNMMILTLTFLTCVIFIIEKKFLTQ